MADRVYKVAQDSEKTTYRVLLTPFGSPEQKDLHGEFFHKGTYFGDDVMTRKYALYEHHVNHLNNPFLPEGKSQVIGVASYVKTDDMGRWFDFEIKRSNDYHDYIEKLVEMKLMGASSQCYAGSKKMNAKVAGQIDEWLESEGSMTVTPASPDTLEKIYDVAKTYAPMLLKKDSSGAILPLTLKETSPAVPVTAADPTPVVDAEEDDADRDEEDADSEKPLSEQVNEILTAPTPEQEAEAEKQTEEEKRFAAAVQAEVAKAIAPLQTAMMKVSGYFDLYVGVFGDLADEEAKARVMELFGLMDKTAGIAAKQKDTDRTVLSIATALKNQGLKVALNLPAPGSYNPAPAAQAAAPGGSRKNNNQPRRVASGIPAHAPGGRS